MSFYCNSQTNIKTIEYLGKTYLLFPENQTETSLTDLPTNWKENIIRKKYKLDRKQSIDGQRIQFFKNSNSIPAKIFELRKNKLNGEYKQFHENGQIRFSLKYSNNKIDNGLFVEYHSNGQRKLSGNLKNGLRDSKWTEYYVNGKIKSEGNYFSGNYIFCDLVLLTKYYEYKVGEWEYYFPNGQIKANGVYKTETRNVANNCINLNCGTLNKEWSFYDTNGNIVPLKNAIKNNMVSNQEIFDKRVYNTE